MCMQTKNLTFYISVSGRHPHRPYTSSCAAGYTSMQIKNVFAKSQATQFKLLFYKVVTAVWKCRRAIRIQVLEASEYHTVKLDG